MKLVFLNIFRKVASWVINAMLILLQEHCVHAVKPYLNAGMRLVQEWVHARGVRDARLDP